jgi:hypothetical protein
MLAGMTFPSKHVSVSIERSASEVYEFVVNPMNLPRWASGLAGAVQKIGADWVADSPMGKLTLKFATDNPFGVLDHAVTTEAGLTFQNPMRVVPNGDGSEVTFVLFRLADMSEQQFAEDAAQVQKDLAQLKAILEGHAKT